MKQQLCAVQMRWQPSDYRNAASFEHKIRSLMNQFRETADPQYPALVAFPEDVGAPLVFLGEWNRIQGAKTLSQAVFKVIRRHLPALIRLRLKYRVGWFRALALYKGAEMAQVYLDVFSRMARDYQVYLSAGSVLLPAFPSLAQGAPTYILQDGRIYNMAFLFGPDGRCLGYQMKTHLVPGLEDAAGFDLCAGPLESLKVFDTSLGRIAIAVCLDCFKAPVLNALGALGADILIQPSANSKPWTAAEQQDWMAGCWQAMQNGSAFQAALNPMMTGALFDLSFEGQSSILLAGCSNALGYRDLPPAPGFATMTADPMQEEVLLLKCDIMKGTGMNGCATIYWP